MKAVILCRSFQPPGAAVNEVTADDTSSTKRTAAGKRTR